MYHCTATIVYKMMAHDVAERVMEIRQNLRIYNCTRITLVGFKRNKIQTFQTSKYRRDSQPSERSDESGSFDAGDFSFSLDDFAFCVIYNFTLTTCMINI